jgi:hypothetical protein
VNGGNIVNVQEEHGGREGGRERGREGGREGGREDAGQGTYR